MIAQIAPADEFRELLIGAGESRIKYLSRRGQPSTFKNVTTLDIDPSHKPDVVHDLNVLPWPFPDNSFDEVHAYQVLEHIGIQGDYRAFFAHFAEIYRILKPNGILMAAVPSLTSEWAWGDPGHTRVVTPHSLVFLDQMQYIAQVGVTAMSDYRFCYAADLTPILSRDDGQTFNFGLQAIKPSRIPEAFRK